MKGPGGGFTLMEDGHLVDLVVTVWLAPRIPREGREEYFGNPDMLHVSLLKEGDGRAGGREGGMRGS